MEGGGVAFLLKEGAGITEALLEGPGLVLQRSLWGEGLQAQKAQQQRQQDKQWGNVKDAWQEAPSDDAFGEWRGTWK